jgi:hypothetical protein
MSRKTSSSENGDEYVKVENENDVRNNVEDVTNVVENKDAPPTTTDNVKTPTKVQRESNEDSDYMFTASLNTFLTLTLDMTSRYGHKSALSANPYDSEMTSLANYTAVNLLQPAKDLNLEKFANQFQELLQAINKVDKCIKIVKEEINVLNTSTSVQGRERLLDTKSASYCFLIWMKQQLKETIETVETEFNEQILEFEREKQLQLEREAEQKKIEKFKSLCNSIPTDDGHKMMESIVKYMVNKNTTADDFRFLLSACLTSEPHLKNLVDMFGKNYCSVEKLENLLRGYKDDQTKPMQLLK